MSFYHVKPFTESLGLLNSVTSFVHMCLSDSPPTDHRLDSRPAWVHLSPLRLHSFPLEIRLDFLHPSASACRFRANRFIPLCAFEMKWNIEGLSSLPQSADKSRGRKRRRRPTAANSGFRRLRKGDCRSRDPLLQTNLQTALHPDLAAEVSTFGKEGAEKRTMNNR